MPTFASDNMSKFTLYIYGEDGDYNLVKILIEKWGADPNFKLNSTSQVRILRKSTPAISNPPSISKHAATASIKIIKGTFV